jgi:hypothetical protein
MLTRSRRYAKKPILEKGKFALQDANPKVKSLIHKLKQRLTY